MRRESLQVAAVGCGDDRSAGKVGDRHGEGVNSHLGARPDPAEELARAHPHARVHRVNFDSFTPQAREHAPTWSRGPRDALDAPPITSPSR